MITSLGTSTRVDKHLVSFQPNALSRRRTIKIVSRTKGSQLVNTPLFNPLRNSTRRRHLCRRHLCRSIEELQDPFNNSSTNQGSHFLDRDEYKESTRVHLRTIFDFDRWAAHRSTRRYIRHLVGIFESRMIRGLAPVLLFVAALSTSVATWHQLVASGIIHIPQNIESIALLSPQPLMLTSTVLGLLLVFRTNASYARWLDARKSWGILVNRSRDLARQGLTWLPKEETALRSLLCRWIIAFSISLKCHLRQGEDAVAELAELGVLPFDELSALAATQHRPNYALQVLSTVLHEMACVLPSTGSAMVSNMDLNLTAIEDVAGTCERILRTPIPLAYSRHTSRFMIIWLSALPFALWEPLHWGMVPSCLVISLLTLGVEDIGVLIEEPFSILPLEHICSTIKNNIEELIEVENAVGEKGDGGGEEEDVFKKVSASELVRRAQSEALK